MGTADNGSTYDITLIDAEYFQYEDGNEIKYITSTSKRYWRIQLDGFQNNGADYLGLIYIGTYYHFPNHSETGFKEGNNFKNVNKNIINGYSDSYNIGNPISYYNNIQIKNLTLSQINSFETEIINNTYLQIIIN